MATDAYALGRHFDIACALSVVDLNAAANTGNRIYLGNAGVCTFVIFADASSDGADLNIDLQEHDAAADGTSQDLDIITSWFKKDETTMDGDESWTKTTQSAGSEIAALGGSAEVENLWVVEVRPEQLSDGFEWVSINIEDVTTAAKYGGALAILSDLKSQRYPTSLPATQ
jgi:hypothetical protein